MKRHVKNFLNYWGHTPQDVIICEACRQERAVDIHHLNPRGMGGNPSGDKDHPSNLIALCRQCHIYAETDKQYNNQLKKIRKLSINGVYFVDPILFKIWFLSLVIL